MIGSYCNDVLYVVKRTLDKWGTATEELTKIKGRIEFKTKLVRNIAGEMVTSSAQVYLPNSIDVNHGDRIQYEEKNYSVINFAKIKDFSSKFIKVDLM